MGGGADDGRPGAAAGGVFPEQAVSDSSPRVTRMGRALKWVASSKADCVGTEDLELNTSGCVDEACLPVGTEQASQLTMIVRATEYSQHTWPIEIDLRGCQRAHLVVLYLVGGLQIRGPSYLDVRRRPDFAHGLLHQHGEDRTGI